MTTPMPHSASNQPTMHQREYPQHQNAKLFFFPLDFAQYLEQTHGNVKQKLQNESKMSTERFFVVKGFTRAAFAKLDRCFWRHPSAFVRSMQLSAG